MLASANARWAFEADNAAMWMTSGSRDQDPCNSTSVLWNAPRGPLATLSLLQPQVQRECIWHGPVYRQASALVDRRNNFVWLATTRDEEPVMLTQHLSDTDSMLASVADPQRAPEMLAVRESVRGWRFYDHFRTDSDSPARAAQIGTFTAVLHHDGSNL